MTTQKNLDDFVEDLLETIKGVMVDKAQQYHIDTDALNVFNRGTKRGRKNRTPLDVLEGMKLKHDLSIDLIMNKADSYWITKHQLVHSNLDIEDRQQLAQEQDSNKVSKESIDEKFNDEIIYWILAKAVTYDIFGYKTKK